MNLFTRNSPYYHLPKYVLFPLKHPVYVGVKWVYTTDLTEPNKMSTLIQNMQESETIK